MPNLLRSRRTRRWLHAIIAVLIGVSFLPLSAYAQQEAASYMHIPEPVGAWPPADKPPVYSGAFPSPHVLIDAGHGGIDGGTSYGDILEKNINLAIARKLYLLLKARGVPVILNRTGDYALSDDNRWSGARSRHSKDLSHRRQLSREVPVSMFVSLHVNWSKRAKATGPLVLHQNEGRSRLLASLIQDSLNPFFSTSTLPKHGKTYYLLRHVDQPAVIVELGYLSNPQDRRMLTDPRSQTAIAARLCEAIVHYHAIY
ncbi:N-acetylmuramoyl-L-alanine amidase [Paenibacillus dendritiformis]|uniref:N-acetylmuramoyl-L-alanine amidase n=1 Tax=Paenibacillus dendritiformis TaxID=130049 RepID=UPI001EE68A54|nr:N-acetylmuramoyl-L-alanine amidase [Paenibacillus dendritiformis]CAH8771926.1 N-acetylmuramoyl-L-alanine amidase [Paenibacillus dendritiformis]